MKRYCLYISLIFACIASLSDGLQASVKEEASSVTASRTYTADAFRFPYADMEILTIQPGSIVHASQPIKKTAAVGGVLCLHPLPYYYFAPSCGSDALRGIHSKNYLSHIHPTHHFW